MKFAIVCAVKEETFDQDEEPKYSEKIEIAGSYPHSTGGKLDPKWEWIPDSGSHADMNREGVRLRIGGGKSKEGTKQQAVFEFLCDKSVDGTEDAQPVASLETRQWPTLRRDDDDGEEDDNGGCATDPSDTNRSLSYCWYGPEQDHEVLRLIWKTKYACPDYKDDDSSGHSSSGWGFFTWLIVM
jgi:autophagy-related protein 27